LKKDLCGAWIIKSRFKLNKGFCTNFTRALLAVWVLGHLCTYLLTLSCLPTQSIPESYDIRRGQPQFDIFTQQESVAEFDGTMLTYTEAVGCLNGDTFSGKFFGAGDINVAVPVAPVIKFEVLGWFRLKLGN
jgi:hypothetical protein